MANKYGVDQEKMLTTLKATAFRGDVTTEQLMALCIVAQQYNLNPWTKEIYAFPDRSGIIPVVGVDGWSRIINEHPECDGIQFKDAEDGSWIECTIFRKDRAHPTTVREYMVEVRRDTGPWKSHPRRMLRHKALIQCARVAFGFGGIYDQDEAERIVAVTPLQANPRDGIETANPVTIDALVSEVADILADDGGDDGEIHADKIFAIHQKICSDDSVYTALLDALAARKVISNANWKKTVAAGSKRFQAGNVEVIR
jgi:phage recombination protein Bet